MTDVVIDARLSLRGLGIATFVERLMAAFSETGRDVPRLWRGSGRTSALRVLSTLAHSGLFDLSPRLDPRTRKAGVVHFASNLGALAPGRNSVVTVHDLMYRRWSRRHYRLTGALLERSLPRAGRVVAVSDRTRSEIERVLPALAGKVEVIPHGMRTRPLEGGDRRHVLAFGGAADPRKRVDFMVAVYREYSLAAPGALPLVVLARAGLTDAQVRELVRLGARIVPDASADEVDGLMRGAAALLYPSAEEGFGLPILEAAEAQTPVVMDAGAAVADEVIGRHCFRVRGSTVETWAEELRRAVASAPVERPLELPSWRTVAERYQALYDEVRDG